MADKYLTCPHYEKCPIYNNYIQQIKHGNQDMEVILFANGHEPYECLAVIALTDSETGIPANPPLDKLIRDVNIKGKKLECSHIELLNLAYKAADR